MKKTDLIRDFILSRVDFYPADVAKRAASHFGLTRQAINLVIHKLEAEGLVKGKGLTRSRRYSLAGTNPVATPDRKLVAAAAEFVEHYSLDPAATEAIVSVARALVRVKG
jgi:hypothetical protein